jgi:hypothetical protein
MITLEKYWMGRDIKYRAMLNHEIIQNAQMTVDKANELLKRFRAETGIDIDTVASGWRPPAVNSNTKNAATGSRHLTARAVDLRDTPDRDLARWCLRNLDQLEDIGLWMEDPQWTWNEKAGGAPWVHLQIVPPGSGRRVYVPSTQPPLAKLLPEQGGDAVGAVA